MTVCRTRSLRRLDLTIATEDHNTPTIDIDKPTADLTSRTQIETLRRNAAEFGVRLHSLGDAGQGIVHVVGPQLGSDDAPASRWSAATRTPLRTARSARWPSAPSRWRGA